MTNDQTKCVIIYEKIAIWRVMMSELLIMSGLSSMVKTADPKYDLILLGFKWSIAGTKNNVLTLKFIHFL